MPLELRKPLVESLGSTILNYNLIIMDNAKLNYTNYNRRRAFTRLAMSYVWIHWWLSKNVDEKYFHKNFKVWNLGTNASKLCDSAVHLLRYLEKNSWKN